ncbi:unnamed protein product [Closterium sp. NIES-53]
MCIGRAGQGRVVALGSRVHTGAGQWAGASVAAAGSNSAVAGSSGGSGRQRLRLGSAGQRAGHSGGSCWQQWQQQQAATVAWQYQTACRAAPAATMQGRVGGGQVGQDNAGSACRQGSSGGGWQQQQQGLAAVIAGAGSSCGLAGQQRKVGQCSTWQCNVQGSALSSWHAKGDCYWCVPPDPGIAAAALGACESGTLPSTAPAQALHTFTLDSGALHSFFRDSTTLTPLPAPVPIRVAHPFGAPVVFTSPRSIRTWSGSRLLLVSPPVAPESSMAPPPGSPLPATPSWYALPSSCLWSTQGSASPPALACPALPFVRRGAVDAGAGGAGVTTGAGGPGGTAAPGSGGARTRGTGAAGTGGVGGAGAGDPMEPAAARAGGPCAGGASTGGTGPGGAGVGGTGTGGGGAAGAGVVDPGAGGASGTVRPRPYFPLLQPASPVPTPSRYTERPGGLTELREHVSRPVLPVRTARRAPYSRPPLVPGTHAMALCPSSVPLRVPLPAPPESTLPKVPDLESDPARAASPTVPHLLATAVTDPSFESAAASALVAKLLDFAAACRLHYATALIAESASASPPSVVGECALGMDVLEDRQEDFESCGCSMDAEMASWKSTSTYVDEIPPLGANIVDGMWIFRGVDFFQTFSPTLKMTTLWVLVHVAAQRDYELHSLDFSTAFLQGSLHEEIWLRRPPGFTESFPAGTQGSLRRPVYGLCQAPREWHDTLRTTLAALRFAPANADPSLFLRTGTSLPPFYVVVYVNDLFFATADTEALTLVISELQKRHTCTDLAELRSYLGLHITRDRARRTITLTQSHMVHQVLQRFGFQFSSPQPTPLSIGHSLSAPPSDKSVEPSGPYRELVSCLMHRKVHWDAAKRVLRYLCSTSGMGLVLGGRGPVVLIGHANASWIDDLATQRSSQGYTFSLHFGSVSWWSTHSSSVLSSNCEAEIYAGAMAAQELRWPTYLLTDLGEQPRSPPVPYVDNKAMIALCQEHRLEHRTKHIALRYFLARELQQRGQLRLAYVATRANTTDIPLGDY